MIHDNNTMRAMPEPPNVVAEACDDGPILLAVAGTRVLASLRAYFFFGVAPSL